MLRKSLIAFYIFSRCHEQYELQCLSYLEFLLCRRHERNFITTEFHMLASAMCARKLVGAMLSYFCCRRANNISLEKISQILLTFLLTQPSNVKNFLGFKQDEQ
jgi:uncharacterized membrane protein